MNSVGMSSGWSVVGRSATPLRGGCLYPTARPCVGLRHVLRGGVSLEGLEEGGHPQPCMGTVCELKWGESHVSRTYGSQRRRLRSLGVCRRGCLVPVHGHQK